MKALLARWLATIGGLGDLLPAPGTTVGSTVGVALFAAVLALPVAPMLSVGLAFVAIVPVAIWACGAEATARAIVDPGAVVLDEVAGQWVALLVIVAATAGRPRWGIYALSFFLFRVFDVLKPWPIRALERLPGGLGIVADDLAAGLAAGLLQVVLMRLLRVG